MDTRDRILDAAADVLTRLGLARTTTKEIARAAGCSEALLYKHFRDKEEIFLGVLKERLPQLASTLATLPARAGTGSVREHLVEVVELAVRFYDGGMAIGSSMLADPVLVGRQREWLRARGQEIPSEHAHHSHEGFMPGMLTAEQMTELAAAKGAAFDELRPDGVGGSGRGQTVAGVAPDVVTPSRSRFFLAS